MKTETVAHSFGRIHSIDALRGITLLGIFLVHMAGMFGFTSYQCALSNIRSDDDFKYIYAAFESLCSSV